MKPFIAFLFIAAGGNAIYHIGQKTLSATANPMIILMGAYGFAFLLSAAALPFFQSPAHVSCGTQALQWPVAALGAGAFLIEIGFLFLYRTGGSLQWSGIAVNGLAALMLIPVAILVYRETFSVARIMGILLTLGGLALIMRK
ncbi:hypothetical protein F6V25_14710 [Oryzomonas japonica]|uniref:EamA domain-containing protein n=1 Tax=Oryzomonas japonica TaxID=2603858 RepID=A0A7J4ZMU1_9BACT|nr:hypothetical protein [Oryzomonas japonica]KAB0664055.1 hypothetical protein F6V25_14710 [Oryzomonas japonica]